MLKDSGSMRSNLSGFVLFRTFPRIWLSLVFMILAALVSGCDSGLDEKEREEISASREAAAEALAMAEEARQKTLEANRIAEETKQLIDEAYEKAHAFQQDAQMRQKTSEVQNGVHQTILAFMAYTTEIDSRGRSGIDFFQAADNESLLYQYGWRRNPDLSYEMQIDWTEKSGPNVVVIVRHQDPSVPAYKYDQNSGRGIEAIE